VWHRVRARRLLLLGIVKPYTTASARPVPGLNWTMPSGFIRLGERGHEFVATTTGASVVWRGSTAALVRQNLCHSAV